MDKATFWIPDALDGPFEGFTKSEEWNGWEVPYFDRETAQAIVTAWQAGNPNDAANYDAQRDVFVFSRDDDGEDGPEEYEGEDTEHGRLYSIGGRVWTWETKD